MEWGGSMHVISDELRRVPPAARRHVRADFKQRVATTCVPLGHDIFREAAERRIAIDSEPRLLLQRWTDIERTWVRSNERIELRGGDKPARTWIV